MDTTPRTALPTQRYANHYGYSDIHPFEVVRVVSEQTLDIRRMVAVLDPTWKAEIIPGGFAGHCTNQSEQRWTYSSDPSFTTTRIRLNKKGRWFDKYGDRYCLSDEPRRFHDFNF
jgi:hypothetical protein